MRSQEFHLGGYKRVKETKQPHKKFKVDWFGGYIYRYTPPRRYAPVFTVSNHFPPFSCGTNAVKGHSWTFKFYKVVWQQIWGKVAALAFASFAVYR